MITDESLTRAKNTLAHLRATDPDYEQHPAVVMAPTWWLREITAHLGQPADTEPEEIHGLRVVKDDAIPEPVAIDHAGVGYPLLPNWARLHARDAEQAKAQLAAADNPAS